MLRSLILILTVVAAIAPAGADDPLAAPGAGPPPTDAPAAVPKRTIYGTIRGTVVGPAGAPFPGVMVQLIARDQSGTLRVTGTDEKGQYAFIDLPAGIYDVEAAAGPGGRVRKERVTVKPPFRNIVDLRVLPADRATLVEGVGDLFAKRPGPPAGGEAAQDAGPGENGDPAATGERPGVPVRGTLLDARRQPAAEAVVTLIAHQGGGIFQAMSGEDGSFLIEAVPPGRYRLRVTSPGHVVLDVASIEVAPGGGMNLSLSLVDYPLAAGDRRAETPPREAPRPLPAAP